MDIALTRGDDATIDVAGVDDEASWAAFTAKRTVRDDDEHALLRKDLADGILIDADGAHVSIDAADTLDLAAPMTLVWDLEVRIAGKERTVASGTLRLLVDVTRDPGEAPGSGS